MRRETSLSERAKATRTVVRVGSRTDGTWLGRAEKKQVGIFRDKAASSQQLAASSRADNQGRSLAGRLAGTDEGNVSNFLGSLRCIAAIRCCPLLQVGCTLFMAPPWTATPFLPPPPFSCASRTAALRAWRRTGRDPSGPAQSHRGPPGHPLVMQTP